MNDQVAAMLAIQAEFERAEREDDEFRDESWRGNVRALAARRDQKVPTPDGEPAITTFMDDDRIIFRDQAALDEYVRGASSLPPANPTP